MYLQDLSYEVIDLLLTTFVVIDLVIKPLAAPMFLATGINAAREGYTDTEPRVQYLHLCVGGSEVMT